MIQTPPPIKTKSPLGESPVESSSDSPTSQTEQASALMVCLEGRRFVIVRTDEPSELHFADETERDLRQIQSGDVVVYRGQPSTVRAVAIYA